MRKRLLAIVLTLCMLLGLAPAAFATEPDKAVIGDETKVKWEKLGEISTDRSEYRNKAASQKSPGEYDDSDIVRVSIVLDEPSTLEKFTSPDGNVSIDTITANPAAIAYAGQLKTRQDAVADSIAREALDGEELDMVWNLTLVANIISANVPYGQIETIKGVNGVSDVFVETRFMAYGSNEFTGQPAMTTSSEQIGSSAAYDVGLYGAGTRIAVIDTGTDLDHQSFNSAALEYALKSVYGDDYADELGLLDVEELTAVYDKLNAKDKSSGIADMSPEKLYQSVKLPFVFNYIDGSLDGTHDHDRMGAHGSHVAGIAAANRFIEKDGEFVKALDAAMVQGVAPDAQILTMKVFGKGGGSYESDHFAAIEDALELKADVINLSIGTYMAGQTYSKEYADVLERLADSDTVVTVSAGNYGSYVDEGTENGRLYLDDVSMDTVGNPGAFTNALTVASVDNIGATGYFITVGEHSMFYLEGSGSNPPMHTIGSDNDLDFVYLDSVGLVAEYELDPPKVTTVHEDQMKKLKKALGDDLEGKVLVVNRGVSPFFAKGNAADELGAKALIIVNNAAGSVGADMAGYNGKIPVVTVNLSTREYFMAGEPKTLMTDYDKDGVKGNGSATVNYYTGKLKISDELTSQTFGEDSVISDFSAWGVPGDLSIKPEITAPGGNIYSVDGSDKATDRYTTMSGTSMSAPQVAGMAALVAEYVKKNVEDGDLSVRQLVQSLLMSTAVPLKDGEEYYPILRQGAGLANVGNAVRAESYITVEGQPDGKVKAELGEDADRSGKYSVTFTLHNLKDTPITYDISADLFTQDIIEIDGEKYMDTATTSLGADIKIYVDGYSAGKSVTVPAGGTAKVQLDLTLTDAARAVLAAYPSGAYIQGFVYATPESYRDGDDLVMGVQHSIPLLAFYGSWTEASMFERLSNEEHIYGLGGRAPYTGVLDTNVLCVYFNGGLYDTYLMTVGAGEGGYRYLADRAAFDPALATLSSYYFTPIRNFANSLLQIVDADTGKVYFREERGDSFAAFYDEDREVWHYADQTAVFDWLGTDLNGVDLPDGTTVVVSLTLAPELYVSESGTAWDKLGDGATISTRVTVDRSAPELLDVEDSHLEDDAPYITVKVRDNEYVSRVTLFSASDLTDEGNLWEVIPNQMIAGEKLDVKLDLRNAVGESFILEVEDYAGHVSVYSLMMDLTARVKSYYSLFAFNEDSWYGYNAAGDGGVIGNSSVTPSAADYGDGYVFFADVSNNFYAMPFGTPTTLYSMGHADVEAMLAGQIDLNEILGLDEVEEYDILSSGVKPIEAAYNPTDNKLYILEEIYGSIYYDWTWADGISYRSTALVSVDPTNGKSDLVRIFGEKTTVTANYEETTTSKGKLFQSLAIDDNGNFFGIESDNWNLYQISLDEKTDHTFLGTILEYETYGEPRYTPMDWDEEKGCLVFACGYYDEEYNGFDEIRELHLDDGKVTTTVIAKATVSEDYESVVGFMVIGNSAASYDFDGSGSTDRISDAQTLLDYVTGERTRIIKNAYADINGDGKINTFDVFALLNMQLGSQTFAPTDDATGVVISQSGAEIRVGGVMTLSAYADPWFLSDRSVFWTSSDPAIVTVNAKGEVTGITPGIATVRAASVLDSSVYAECTVQVLAAEYDLSGIVMDAASKAQLFSMDVAHLEDWEKTSYLSQDLDIISGTYYAPTDAPDDDYAYVMDSGFRIHKVDPATGDIIASSGQKHYPLSDMTVLEGVSDADRPMILGVYGPMLLFGIDGWDSDTFESGFLSMAYALPELGAEALVGVAYAGSFDEGEAHYEVVYAIDDVGDFWLIYFDFTDPSNPVLEQALPIFTDLPADKVQADAQNVYLSSMIVSDIDTVLFSRQNGKTAEIYLLEREEYVDNGDVVNYYSAARVTDMGEDCFPAVLFEAISTAVPDNGWDEDGEDYGGGYDDGYDYDGIGGFLTLNEVLTPIAAKDPAVNAAAGGISGVRSSNVSASTVKLSITVDEDTTNGRITLSYKPGEVRLVSVGTLAELASVHDNRDGTISIAWASTGTPFTAGQSIAELTFERLSSSVGMSAVKTLVEEMGGANGEDVLEDVQPVPSEDFFAFRAPAPSDTPFVRNSISLPDSVPHGAVKSDRLDATAGENVTLTVTPEVGYSVDSVAVTDSVGGAVAVAVNSDGTYTFTMPSSEVSVSLTFRFTCDGGEDCVSMRFPDVELNEWYHEYTDYVIGKAIMNGDNGLFRPHDSITRAELATVLWNLGGNKAAGDAVSFTDVADGAWYARAVRWAAGEGIVNGYEDGSFRPDQAVSREEMTVMLYRYEQKLGGGFAGEWEYEFSFSDADKVSDWACEAVKWCAMNSVINGKENNMFDPAGSTERCELAAVLTRYLTLDAAESR